MKVTVTLELGEDRTITADQIFAPPMINIMGAVRLCADEIHAIVERADRPEIGASE